MNSPIRMKLGLLARSMTQSGSIALLFLAPVVGMANVIGGCAPGFCSYVANETIVGNVVTIDFLATAEHGGGFTLSEILVTDSSGGPGFLGLANITLFAGVYGPATDSGVIGGPSSNIGCEATSAGNGGPDGFPVVNHCYHGGVVFPDFPLGQIPVDMVIQLGNAGFGSNGEVFLQASFSEMNTQTGQVRPLSVNFLVPEPSSIVLCGLGLAGLVLGKRGRSKLRQRIDGAHPCV